MPKNINVSYYAKLLDKHNSILLILKFKLYKIRFEIKGFAIEGKLVSSIFKYSFF